MKITKVIQILKTLPSGLDLVSATHVDQTWKTLTLVLQFPISEDVYPRISEVIDILSALGNGKVERLEPDDGVLMVTIEASWE